MKDNCSDCMFSEYSEINIMINEHTGHDNSTCVHENSPYYNEMVNEDKSCRQFLDTNKYFKQRDRKDKLDNLNAPKNNLDY